MFNRKSGAIFFTFILSFIFVANAVSGPTDVFWKTSPNFIVASGSGLDFNPLSSKKLEFTNEPGSQQTAVTKSKSTGKAIFLSFAIPGVGEYYAGQMGRARAFFITEVILWSTYAGFKIYENWIEDEYKTFAATHARVNPENKAHKYFVNVGNYDNIYEYNAAKLNYRSLDEVYPLTAEYAWQWDSFTNRHDFKMMRIRSDNANYRALFTLGVILVNHLVSAIDAVWVTRKANAEQIGAESSSAKIQFVSIHNQGTYQVVLTKHFNFSGF